MSESPRRTREPPIAVAVAGLGLVALALLEVVLFSGAVGPLMVPSHDAGANLAVVDARAFVAPSDVFVSVRSGRAADLVPRATDLVGRRPAPDSVVWAVTFASAGDCPPGAHPCSAPRSAQKTVILDYGTRAWIATLVRTQ